MFPPDLSAGKIIWGQQTGRDVLCLSWEGPGGEVIPSSGHSMFHAVWARE